MSATKKSKDKLYIKQSISLSPEMIEQMKELAAQERRSLSNMMQIATEFYLQHKDDHAFQLPKKLRDSCPPSGMLAAETHAEYQDRRTAESLIAGIARTLHKEDDLDIHIQNIMPRIKRPVATAQRPSPAQKRHPLMDTLAPETHKASKNVG